MARGMSKEAEKCILGILSFTSRITTGIYQVAGLSCIKLLSRLSLSEDRAAGGEENKSKTERIQGKQRNIIRASD